MNRQAITALIAERKLELEKLLQSPFSLILPGPIERMTRDVEMLELWHQIKLLELYLLAEPPELAMLPTNQLAEMVREAVRGAITQPREDSGKINLIEAANMAVRNLVKRHDRRKPQQKEIALISKQLNTRNALTVCAEMDKRAQSRPALVPPAKWGSRLWMDCIKSKKKNLRSKCKAYISRALQ